MRDLPPASALKGVSFKEGDAAVRLLNYYMVLPRALKMEPKGLAPSAEAPPPDWSRKMYRAMKMSCSQRRAAVAYRNHLLLRLGDTLRARRDISLELLRTLGGARAEATAGVCPGSNPPCCAFFSDVFRQVHMG